MNRIRGITPAQKQIREALYAQRGGNKYGARKTYSELCGRTFDSAAEARRGEELVLLQTADKIKDLHYQSKWYLSHEPKVSIKIDFVYYDKENLDENGCYIKVYEDVKGVLTRDFRTKLIWLKEKWGIDVKLIR